MDVLEVIGCRNYSLEAPDDPPLTTLPPRLFTFCTQTDSDSMVLLRCRCWLMNAAQPSMLISKSPEQSDLTVVIRVEWPRIGYVSVPGSHTDVTQIGFEKIRVPSL